jgi:hypothetical protein
MTRKLVKFAEATAIFAEKIGAVLGWRWLMVVVVADSEVGGRKGGGSRLLMLAPRCASDHSTRACHPAHDESITGTSKCPVPFLSVKRRSKRL